MFMSPEDLADFVPYLYDGNLQFAVSPDTGERFSVFRNVRNPRDDTVKLDVLATRGLVDDLLPLMSLQLCESNNLLAAKYVHVRANWTDHEAHTHTHHVNLKGGEKGRGDKATNSS